MPGQEKIVSVRIAPAKQDADLQTDGRHNRDHGIAQRMHANDPKRLQRPLERAVRT